MDPIPFQNGNGNPYARVIHDDSDSYGYSYSDSTKVLLSIDPAKVDTLKITILEDNTTDGCSRPSVRLATGNFDGSGSNMTDGTSSGRIRDDLAGTTFNGQIYFALNATNLDRGCLLYGRPRQLGATAGNILIESRSYRSPPATVTSIKGFAQMPAASCGKTPLTATSGRPSAPPEYRIGTHRSRRVT